ncbi:MAG: SRPBCC family protein [Dehalococcoidales bacterium]
MPRVDNEVIINAPAAEIYRYVSQPGNLPQIWPSLLEITHTQLLANGGYSYRWKYKMSGISLSGTGECVENKPNQLLVSRNIGDFESTVTFTFQSFQVRTRVYLSFDYKLLGLLSNHLTENIILRMNTKEAGLILDNLRIVLEANLAAVPQPV